MKGEGRMNQNQFNQSLPKQNMETLRAVARILQAERTKLVKGGVRRKFRKKELIKSIRRKLANLPGRGDQLERAIWTVEYANADPYTARKLVSEQIDKHADWM